MATSYLVYSAITDPQDMEHRLDQGDSSLTKEVVYLGIFTIGALIGFVTIDLPRWIFNRWRNSERKSSLTLGKSPKSAEKHSPKSSPVSRDTAAEPNPGQAGYPLGALIGALLVGLPAYGFTFKLPKKAAPTSASNRIGIALLFSAIGATLGLITDAIRWTYTWFRSDHAPARPVCTGIGLIVGLARSAYLCTALGDTPLTAGCFGLSALVLYPTMGILLDGYRHGHLRFFDVASERHIPKKQTTLGNKHPKPATQALESTGPKPGHCPAVVSMPPQQATTQHQPRRILYALWIGFGISLVAGAWIVHARFRRRK